MSYDGRAVANFVLDYCDQKNREITQTALQKIVYFCHVWSLVSLKRPLIKHKFEAWDFGPVLPYLYRQFKGEDRSPLTSRAMHIDPLDGTKRIVEHNFDSQTSVFLKEIIDFYSRMRAGDLTKLSHVSGGPWDKVWNHPGRTKPGMKIDDKDIELFYSKAQRPFAIQ